jgi:hypothetical protein
VVRGSQGRKQAQGREASSAGEAPSSKPDEPRTARSGRGRHASSELDARQLQAIALYITNPNKTVVAAEIGVTRKSISRWFQSPLFVAEYQRQLGDVQFELWAQMVAVKNEAWERFKKLMADPDPRISLRATTWFLDRFLSSPGFLPGFLRRSAARETGIGAGLERRERELLERVGALGRGDAEHGDARRSDDGPPEGAGDDPSDDDDYDAGGAER